MLIKMLIFCLSLGNIPLVCGGDCWTIIWELDVYAQSQYYKSLRAPKEGGDTISSFKPYKRKTTDEEDSSKWDPTSKQIYDLLRGREFEHIGTFGKARGDAYTNTIIELTKVIARLEPTGPSTSKVKVEAYDAETRDVLKLNHPEELVMFPGELGTDPGRDQIFIDASIMGDQVIEIHVKMDKYQRPERRRLSVAETQDAEAMIPGQWIRKYIVVAFVIVLIYLVWNSRKTLVNLSRFIHCAKSIEPELYDIPAPPPVANMV